MKQYTGKPQLIKTVNQDMIMDVLRAHPGITQPQVAKLTGISLATVNKTIKELLDADRVVCVGDGESTGGRRAKQYEINQNSGYVVCVYIQGNGYNAAIANILGEPQEYCGAEHDPRLSREEELMALLDRLVGGRGRERLEGIAVAVPGTVMNGSVYNIPAIPEWEGVCLESIIRREYDCRLMIENDINAAAMGSCGRHMGPDKDNIAFISVLNNIGAGLIINGHVYSSRKHFSGELAYMAVNGSRGIDNGRGAAEALIQKALEDRDREALLELISYLIVNVCCVIDPDAVVIVCPYIREADVEELSGLVRRYIEKAFAPQILLEEGDIRQYLNGLIAICIEGVSRPMQIVR